MNVKICKTSYVNKLMLFVIALVNTLTAIIVTRALLNGNLDHNKFFISIFFIIIATLLDVVVYFKNKNGLLLRRISIWGYALVYTIVLFNLHNDYFFILFFPLATFYILYYDFKFMVLA